MDQMTHEQALQVVKEMINKTKEKQCYAGFYHLLWGIIVAVALAAMYFLLRAGKYGWIGYSWAFFGLTGGIISYLYYRRTYEKQGNLRYPDLGINAMWIGTMISMIFATFVFPILGAYNWSVVFVMVCLLLGAANFSTGLFLKEFWSLIHGTLWWTGSVILLLIRKPDNYFTLMTVFVVLLVINNIIPGIILSFQARKRYAE